MFSVNRKVWTRSGFRSSQDPPERPVGPRGPFPGAAELDELDVPQLAGEGAPVLERDDEGVEAPAIQAPGQADQLRFRAADVEAADDQRDPDHAGTGAR